MFHFFKYKTPEQYATDFKETSSYDNVRQVKNLSSIILSIALVIRLVGFIYNERLLHLPGKAEYEVLNIIQTVGALVFLLLSNWLHRQDRQKSRLRHSLSIAFILFVLSITFGVSYIFSMHNAKNTLTVFLVGIMTVSVFFSTALRPTLVAAAYVIFLFVCTTLVEQHSFTDRMLNFICAGILGFALYAFTRYSYYFKSQHFVQLKRLQETNEQVQLLSRQKSEILGFVAHDLRAPLNNIEAISGMMLTDGTSEQLEIRMIQSASRQAKYIINDLIEVVQEQKAPLVTHQLNLSSCLKNITEHWQANVDEPRRIIFHTNNEQLQAGFNLSKFTRVMDNLISNGLKFSKPETPIEIDLIHHENTCTIQVRDHGIGIPEHLHQLLFDQFSKAGRPGLQGEKSMGLGLHICRQMVEQHGWQIRIDSKEKKGTVFSIEIPAEAISAS